MGDPLQPAGPDAVRAFLVFLHLLEGEPERVTQLLLAHSKHKAAHPHPAADVLVDGVPPTPPAEKATARQDQAGKSSTGDGAGDTEGKQLA